MPKDKSAVLECVLCSEKYTVKDARKGLYFIRTRVCLACYKAGAKADSRIWCFGKKQRKQEFGFSVSHIECTSLCPDRDICKQFVTIKEKK